MMTENIEHPAAVIRSAVERLRADAVPGPVKLYPLVAVAVAGWLDAAAQAWDEGMERDEALAVAKAYLGQPS